MWKEEGRGKLKVVVMQGKRLVIRDFKSSDPYVVITFGNQVAKTKVIKSCLNPVWNEELSFKLEEPLPIPNPILYLEVFDKDRFKADDKMGFAHLNIQPFLSAARLQQVLKTTTTTTTSLRKVIPDAQNCLVRESYINCVNGGDVIQEVWLRLCGVESGEIQFQLKLETPPVCD
ncbi:protein C2-DOMAIN ABA-RELATED 11 isoform X2 [Silene latifolia]|uniref:protein C2-DOMAIN ABA-RELATED 11 isoform X2 n=1 Tax=Silene latifolia TaxID=37657 RepID=UPI003D789844